MSSSRHENCLSKTVHLVTHARPDIPLDQFGRSLIAAVHASEVDGRGDPIVQSQKLVGLQGEQSEEESPIRRLSDRRRLEDVVAENCTDESVLQQGADSVAEHAGRDDRAVIQYLGRRDLY